MKRIAPVALAILLVSCASPPPPGPVETDVEMASAWTVEDSLLAGVTADELQQNWWTEIGGTALDSLVREALDANYSLAIAAANVEAARAGADIAGAPRLPRINASYGARRQEQALIGIPVGPDPVLKTLSSSHTAQITANWEVDLWNKLGKLEQAALADYEATEADLAGVRLSIAAGVTRTWLNLVEARAQADLAARAYEAFSRTAETSWDRYQRGLIPAIDVHLTRTSRDNAAALLAFRRQQVEVFARQLELLLGRYPRAELDSPIVLPDAPAMPPAGLPADLLLRRPDLLAAERRLVAAGARTSSAQRAMLPTISLTGAAGFTSNALGDVLKGDFSVWSIGGSLLQPIFQGGRLRAQARQNAAFETALVNSWANQVLTAFGEVEVALASEQWLREREEKLRSSSDSALAAYELSESRYRQGVGSLFEVLESQRRALDAEGQWIVVRNARLNARIDLFLALGGGFDAQDGAPVTDFLITNDTEPRGADR
jgi:NodT family efflux transporter outer membrane factor (OMF) lipoprotein